MTYKSELHPSARISHRGTREQATVGALVDGHWTITTDSGSVFASRERDLVAGGWLLVTPEQQPTPDDTPGVRPTGFLPGETP